MVNSLGLLPSQSPTRGITERYRPLTLQALRKSRYWQLIPPELRNGLEVVSRVLPFRVNEYIARELIDWDRVAADPMFQMALIQPEMLEEKAFRRLRSPMSSSPVATR